MRDASFFTKPLSRWQRRYEALRASLGERLPYHIVAERYGFSLGYLRLLRHQLRHEKIDFSESVADDGRPRLRINGATRQKIIEWRQHDLSAGDISQLLSQEGVDISVRTQ